MIKELSSLRGVFIMCIFVHHLNLYASGGTLGVAFFFVLSGFSLTLGYEDKIVNHKFSYKKYMLRRLVKFYPLHWLCLLLAFPYALSSSHDFSVPVFVVNAALLQTWISRGDFYFSFNSVSWFLADTIFLSVIFPFLCKFILNHHKKYILFIVSSLFVIYGALQALLYDHNVFYFTYINPIARIPDFVVGIFLALIFVHYRDRGVNNTIVQRIVNPVCLTTLCVISIVVLMIESTMLVPRQTEIAFFYWPLISVVILSAAFLGTYFSGGGNIFKSRWLVKFGELSFDFYMVHLIIIRYVSIIFQDIIDIRSIVLFSIVTFLTSILFSFVIHFYVGKPITNWLTTSIINHE